LRPSSTWFHSRSATSLARRPCRVGNKDQRRVTMRMAAAAGRSGEPGDLGFGQVIAGTQRGVGRPLQPNG
jgi:hypothetical protein